jgi:nitroreductase
MEKPMENIALSNLLIRRSVRKYKNEPVPAEIVLNLLKAAMNAPSACNQQVRHYVILEDKAVLNELSKIHSGYTTLKSTPTAILVCGEPDAAILPSFWEHDCAAATQNILIAAASYGLGAVWQGVNPSGKEDASIIRRCVNLPENIHPFSIVSLGYPAETPTAKCKFDEKKIHYNSKW